MLFKISEIKNAAVIGAGHGIGLELVRSLLAANSQVRIYATYRDNSKASSLLELAKSQENGRLRLYQIDPTKEAHLKSFQEQLDAFVTLELVLISVGLLHNGPGMQPEKGLRDITEENLHQSFRANAFTAPLVAKHLQKRFAKNAPSAFVALSAKVGSIRDNRLGGWYSYRASKAALNMFMKTISIEFARSHLSKMSVMALHPGTTETSLSAPFLANVKYPVLKASEAAENILRVIEQSHAQGTGLFKDWDGTDLPW